MKYLAHVPTEQYGFISVELEEGESPDALNAIVELYQRLKTAYSGGEGLPVKEFNRFIDCYVQTGKPPVDGIALWECMDISQRNIINEVKKSFKRNSN